MKVPLDLAIFSLPDRSRIPAGILLLVGSAGLGTKKLLASLIFSWPYVKAVVSLESIVVESIVVETISLVVVETVSLALFGKLFGVLGTNE